MHKLLFFTENALPLTSKLAMYCQQTDLLHSQPHSADCVWSIIQVHKI